MTTIQKQIENIEKEIRETPYHKATEHHIGKLRAKLAKLRDKQIGQKIKKRGGGRGYAIKKQGDATVVLVGPPSVGKSTLLNKLTNAKSKIAPYAFTTVSVIPGMMKYKDAQIQILDVPGLIEGAEEGRGRGREVLSVARGADLLIILCDVGMRDKFEQITKALEKTGIRINKEPPNVSIVKKVRGGIIIHSNIKHGLSKDTIKDIAQELGIKNAEITIKEKLKTERLIDAFSPNRVYIPAIYLINKSDLLKNETIPAKYNNIYYYSENSILISAKKGKGINKLKQSIWENLNLVRIYLVKANEKPSFKHPVIMKKDQILYNVAEKIGTEFAEDKTRAKIWGPGAKHPGQEVSLSKKVVGEMQVRFI